MKKFPPGLLDYREPEHPIARFNVTEAFRWLSSDLVTDDYGPKTVKVKGVALTSNIVSKNKRKYIDEELKKAARTLKGKPITVNHNPREIIGNVEWAEYEDGRVEFIGKIKSQKYADMIREKHPDIRGLSVEGVYLHNICVKCGAKFDTEEQFRAHMKEVHGIVDGITEVHGLHLTGLSLVVAPEIPGVDTTEIEIMEMAHATNRLYEIKVQEVENMQKLKEQDEKPPQDWWNNCVATVKQSMPDYTDEQVNAVCGYIWHHKPEQHGIGEIKGLTEKVEKRGDKWCVIHCTGPDAGKPIKCFDSKEEAEAMHKAIQAQKARETEQKAARLTEAAEELIKWMEQVEPKLKEIDKLNTAVADLQQAVESLKQPKLNETQGLSDRLKKLEARQDNLEHALGKLSEFKGHSPRVVKETSDDTVVGDPAEELRETAKRRR